MRQHKTARGWQRDPTRNKNLTHKNTWDAGIVPKSSIIKKEYPTKENPFIREKKEK